MGLFDTPPLLLNLKEVFRKTPFAGVHGRAKVISRSPSAQHYWETDDERNMGYGNIVEIKTVSVGDYVFSQSGTYTKVLKVNKRRVPYDRWNAVYVDDPFPLDGVMEYNEAERSCFKRKGFFIGYMTSAQQALCGIVSTYLYSTRQIAHPFLRHIAASQVLGRFRGSPYAGRISDIPKDAYRVVGGDSVFLFYDEDTVKKWARNDLVKKVNGQGTDVVDKERERRGAPNYVQSMTLKAVSLDYNIMGDDTAYSLVTENGTFVANGLYLLGGEG